MQPPITVSVSAVIARPAPPAVAPEHRRGGSLCPHRQPPRPIDGTIRSYPLGLAASNLCHPPHDSTRRPSWDLLTKKSIRRLLLRTYSPSIPLSILHQHRSTLFPTRPTHIPRQNDAHPPIQGHAIPHPPCLTHHISTPSKHGPDRQVKHTAHSIKTIRHPKGGGADKLPYRHLAHPSTQTFSPHNDDHGFNTTA